MEQECDTSLQIRRACCKEENCSLCPLGIQKELMDLNCSKGNLRKTLGQAF